MKWYKTLCIILLGLGTLLGVIFLIIYCTQKRNWKKATDDLWANQEYLKNFSKSHPNENKITFPVLYINQARNARRRFFMERQFKKIKINFERIEAVDGRHIVKDEDNIDGIQYRNNYKLSKKELACTLSHLKAIKYAYNKGMDKVVIMEDNISLTLIPFWEKTLPKLLSSLKDWNIVQLHNGSNNYKNNPDLFSTKEYENRGSAAYVLNRKGMENVMKKSFYRGIFYLDRKKIKCKGNPDSFIYFCAEKSG